MSGTIFSRIDSQVREMETQTWRCRLDAPSTLLDHIDAQCVLITPPSMSGEQGGGGGLVTSTSSPTVEETLEAATAPSFTRFDMLDVEVLEIGMMAAVIVYRVEAVRRVGAGAGAGGRGIEVPYRAYCSSAWKQGADAKWKLCCHQETPY